MHVPSYSYLIWDKKTCVFIAHPQFIPITDICYESFTTDRYVTTDIYNLVL